MRRTIGYAVAALAVFALISGCCMLPEKEAPRPRVTEEAETVEAEPEPRDPGLYVQLLGSPDGPAAAAHVDIFTAGTDEQIAGDWANGERRFTLPSGTYDLVVHVADARIRREGVEVSEDEYQPVDVVLDAGTLELRFLDEADGELVNANVTIYHAGDDGSRGGAGVGGSHRRASCPACRQPIWARQAEIFGRLSGSSHSTHT